MATPTTRIDASHRIEGTLRAGESVSFHGHMLGDVLSDDLFVVEATAIVEGDVVVQINEGGNRKMIEKTRNDLTKPYLVSKVLAPTTLIIVPYPSGGTEKTVTTRQVVKLPFPTYTYMFSGPKNVEIKLSFQIRFLVP